MDYVVVTGQFPTFIMAHMRRNEVLEMQEMTSRHGVNTLTVKDGGGLDCSQHQPQGGLSVLHPDIKLQSSKA